MRINLIDTMRANSKTLRFRQRGLPNTLIQYVEPEEVFTFGFVLGIPS